MLCLACCRPASCIITPVPNLLSSLLHSSRTAVLVLLLVVLPLQGVVQLVAGLQGHRHVHTGAAHESLLSGLTQPLRALLDHLHAAQDPRLQGHKLGWLASKGTASGMHEHGGVFHKHSADTADVIEVGDAADDSLQGGVTAFLAWLPAALAMMAADGASDRPALTDLDWRDRVIAPPLTPPRG